jgi:hypothetical protein
MPDDTHRTANRGVVGTLDDMTDAPKPEGPERFALLPRLSDLAANLANPQNR